MTKKRILFLLHLPPPYHGAAMVGSYLQKSELIRNRFNVHFINISTSGALNEIGRMTVMKLVRYFRTWCRLFVYLVKSGRPDLIYVTPAVRGTGLIKELPLLCFIRMLSKPFVVHFHNKGLSEYLVKHDLLSGIIKWIFGYGRAQAVVISNRLANDVNSYFSASNIHSVPYGIPMVGEEYMNMPRSGRKLVFLGNLIISKGILDFLDACRILSKKGIGIEAVIIGGEADLTVKDLEAEIKQRELKEVCRYMGPLYDHAKLKVLGSADIFVFPTYYPYETFGLVNIEAMACGLPVISTDEGGIPDLVEDGKTGYIVPARAPGEIAEKIEVLVNNGDLCRRMGRAGREKYLDAYTISKFIERMVDLMTKCLVDGNV